MSPGRSLNSLAWGLRTFPVLVCEISRGVKSEPTAVGVCRKNKLRGSLCILCDSVVNEFLSKFNHRDAEDHRDYTENAFFRQTPVAGASDLMRADSPCNKRAAKIVNKSSPEKMCISRTRL